jgi:Cytochrome bd terminal oxidase subunit II
VLHLLIARTEEERATVIRTIGSVWDGNEMWLIAGGGTLYFAFPLALRGAHDRRSGAWKVAQACPPIVAGADRTDRAWRARHRCRASADDA